ncbi:sensor histidine kinase [Taklimakanibacter deserti]|uniref:sensor histidine kinase n=1 Tax=Taklimakanibacter deserti TaxID=2267839 RepID=UPI000E65E135
MLTTDATTVPAAGAISPAAAANGVVIGDSETIPWERDLLTMFVKNQLKVVYALPLFAALFALMTLQWAPWQQSLAWFVAAVGCQAIQVYLCRQYLQLCHQQHKSKPKKSQFHDWLGMMTASEFFIAACWSSPLFLLWDNASDLQHIYIVASLMAIVAVRIMISANFMPIIVAGTGLITLALALRCTAEQSYLYSGLGALAIGCQIFFALVARKLQETARDMFIFKAQKDELFSQLVVERDKAESARAEAERERLRAEEASKAKSQFLATMSHELRTPLNAILGFSEIISREMFGRHEISAYKTYANDIHNSGSYLLSLVNDILDLTRIEAGRRDMREEPLAIADSLEDVRNFVAFKLREKSQDLVFDIPANLPKVLVDHRSVRQIWINLLSNAAKFSPVGGEILVMASQREGGEIAVSFIDNGPGMPEEEIELAMQAFARGSLAVKKAVDGAGLGLPIVKGLINMHGGSFELRSKPGHGTEATVVFPFARVLSGPRAEVIAEAATSPSQRKLIAITS